MIGARIAVQGDRFDYVFGLLLDDGGLTPEVDVMPVGGADVLITPEAWDGLDSEIKNEIARFSRPGGDVVVQPAGDDKGTGRVEGAAENSRPGRPTRSTTTKGVTDGR